MKKISIICLVFILITFLCGGLHYAYSQYTDAIFIKTSEKTIRLTYELADNHEKQITGLMYRKNIPDNYGMIFIFPKTKILYMWMKNTYIPLDMIFFDETGKITHIYQNAQPLDTSIISSKKPSKGVIEVSAGFASKHKISIGDKVNHPSLNH